jgi:hypothetical protein
VQVDEAGQGVPGDGQGGGISRLTATMAQFSEPHLPPHDVQMIGCDQLDDLGHRSPSPAAFRTTRSDCHAQK